MLQPGDNTGLARIAPSMRWRSTATLAAALKEANAANFVNHCELQSVVELRANRKALMPIERNSGYGAAVIT
jgi:hypothetical protein